MSKKHVVDGNYSSEQYWNSRYESNNNSHDWYYNFDVLKPLIELTIKKNHRKKSSVYDDIDILEIGCGDRPLAIGIAKQNPKSIHAIDFSRSIITLLKRDVDNNNQSVLYQEMDARKMTYLDSSFDFVVDKGTIDAMLCCDDRKESYKNVTSIISETIRVMKNISSFMIISHIEVESDEFDELMQEILLPVLTDYKESVWTIEAHVVNKSQIKKRKQKKDNNGYGTVYTISRSIRKLTRNSLNTPSVVNFEVLEYDES